MATRGICISVHSILNELLQITTEIAFIIPGHQCFVSLADTYQQVLYKICSFEYCVFTEQALKYEQAEELYG